MTINTALAGKTYPTLTYEVTADAIRTYAAATNEDNPAFTGSDPVGPPAFPIVPAQAVLGGALFDPELEVNLMRLVHGEEDHLLLAPIRPGDTLTVEGRLESIDVKESGETFTVFTRLTNQDGVVMNFQPHADVSITKGTLVGIIPYGSSIVYYTDGYFESF